MPCHYNTKQQVVHKIYITSSFTLKYFWIRLNFGHVQLFTSLSDCTSFRDTFHSFLILGVCSFTPLYICYLKGHYPWIVSISASYCLLHRCALYFHSGAGKLIAVCLRCQFAFIFSNWSRSRVTLCLAKKGPPARVSHRRTWVQWLWQTAVQLKIDQGRSTGPVEPGEQPVPQRSLPAVPRTTRSVPLQGLSMDAKPTACRAGLVSVVKVCYKLPAHNIRYLTMPWGSKDWSPESNGDSLAMYVRFFATQCYPFLPFFPSFQNCRHLSSL